MITLFLSPLFPTTVLIVWLTGIGWPVFLPKLMAIDGFDGDILGLPVYDADVFISLQKVT